MEMRDVLSRWPWISLLTTGWTLTENLPKEGGHQKLTKRRCPNGKDKEYL